MKRLRYHAARVALRVYPPGFTRNELIFLLNEGSANDDT